MNITTFSRYLGQIENTASRSEMTGILAKMLSETRVDEIEKVVYLSLGVLGPLYRSIEFSMSDKLMLRAIGRAIDEDIDTVEQSYKEIGDIGLLFTRKAMVKDSSESSVESVFNELLAIALLEGSGSQEDKIERMAALLNRLDSLSAKYIARIPVGKLRLGFSDITLLDALSWMENGDKLLRSRIERAYNVVADIGLIAKTIKSQGIIGLDQLSIVVGVPIRPAAAERLPTAQAIIDKLGSVVVQPKIDGFRLQIHFQKDGLIGNNQSRLDGKSGDRPEVSVFSRNLEDMTPMFPEIVSAVKRLPVSSIVFEGEAVAYDQDTNKFLPFQETIQRRRKHGVAEMSLQIPLKLFAFDLLYLNGEDCLAKSHRERRRLLENSIGSESEGLTVIEEVSIDSAVELGRYFDSQIDAGLEGIVAKRPDSPYSAGARNFNWVKLKREDKSELDDSIDCVVLGYKYGKGKRTGFGIGAFLVGVYDTEQDRYQTISNVGTGLTDEQWVLMKSRCEALKASKKPLSYDVPEGLEQDVWVEPKMVVEILADEITRSPQHTAGMAVGEAGYALRFPRLISWRDDKSAEQATSVAEIKTLFKQQKKRGRN